MRADGSTKFAPGNQWGYFPSVSGAWVLSEEKFMEDIKWIDQLKLRAARGWQEIIVSVMICGVIYILLILLADWIWRSNSVWRAMVW